jgi:hypothetical protein
VVLGGEFGEPEVEDGFRGHGNSIFRRCINRLNCQTLLPQVLRPDERDRVRTHRMAH